MERAAKVGYGGDTFGELVDSVVERGVGGRSGEGHGKREEQEQGAEGSGGEGSHGVLRG